MLRTNLDHIQSKDELEDLIKTKEKVIVVCGRMGPMCVPVYGIMEELREKNKDINFKDMEFDHPDAAAIRNLPECQNFMGLPFTVYYRDGKVVKATSSIQSAKDVKKILKDYLN